MALPNNQRLFERQILFLVCETNRVAISKYSNDLDLYNMFFLWKKKKKKQILSWNLNNFLHYLRTDTIIYLL